MTGKSRCRIRFPAAPPRLPAMIFAAMSALANCREAPGMIRPLTLAVVFLAAISTGAGGAANSGDTSFECSLFGAVLNSIGPTVRKPILIEPESGGSIFEPMPDGSISHAAFELIQKKFPALLEETYRSFTERNSQPLHVECNGVKPGGHTPIVADDTAKPGTAKWTISRAGTDAAHTQAFFYVEIDCGAHCGWGRYFFFERKNEKWVISGSALVWIS